MIVKTSLLLSSFKQIMQFYCLSNYRPPCMHVAWLCSKSSDCTGPGILQKRILRHLIMYIITFLASEFFQTPSAALESEEVQFVYIHVLMVTWICMHALEFNRLHLPRLVVCLRESLRQASVHVVNCLKNLMINNYFFVICAKRSISLKLQTAVPRLSIRIFHRH